MEAADAIGAAIGLAGVIVGWLLASRTAGRISREEREERRRSELPHAVVVYWHELERFEDELRQLPPTRENEGQAAWRRVPLIVATGAALANNQAVQAARWLWGIILRRVFAREPLEALEAFKRTSRPLLFIGAPTIQELVGDAVVLVGERRRDQAWWNRWEEMKLRLLTTARDELGGQVLSASAPNRPAFAARD